MNSAIELHGKKLTRKILISGPNGELIHKCSCCSKYFDTEDNMKLHIQEAHGACLRCKICDTSYKNSKSLYIHTRVKHLNIKWDKKKSSVKKFLYICEKCGQEFSSRLAMEKHERTDCGSRTQNRVKCEICDKSYKHSHSLYIHMRAIHLKNYNKYTYTCAKCGRKFVARNALENHEQSNCGQSPIYKCDFPNCNKALHSRGSLKSHKLIHFDDFPFECNHCKKRFRTKHETKKHERIHSGKKNSYICTKCGQGFESSDARADHEQVDCDHVENPLKCKICYKFYLNSKSLYNHMRRIHSKINHK